MASPAVDFARQNQQRFLNELKDLLRIPSISTAPEHKSDVQRAADYVAGELRRIDEQVGTQTRVLTTERAASGRLRQADAKAAASVRGNSGPKSKR